MEIVHFYDSLYSHDINWSLANQYSANLITLHTKIKEMLLIQIKETKYLREDGATCLGPRSNMKEKLKSYTRSQNG